MKARIEMTVHGRGRVFLDGIEQKHVTAIRLECSMDGGNVLVIETTHLVDEFEFDGEVGIEVRR